MTNVSPGWCWAQARQWMAIVLLCGLVGCASNSRMVSGQPPLVDLESLEQRGDLLLIDLRIRNLNDQRLDSPIRHIRLSLDGQTAILDQAAPQALNIPARGREIVRLTATADSATQEALAALSQERGQSLPYQLTLTFEGRRASRTPVEQSGFLHPVPGQAGRFR